MIVKEIKKSIKTVTQSVVVEQYFESFSKEPTDREKKEFPEFRVRCCVSKRRPPRHGAWDYIRDMGMNNLDKIFKKEPVSGCITLIFPERWIDVAEQQCLYHCIKNNPNVANITQVDIITSSPLVVSPFLKEQVRILTFEDDNEYCGS